MANIWRSIKVPFIILLMFIVIASGFYVWQHESFQRVLPGVKESTKSAKTYVSDIPATVWSSFTDWKSKQDPRTPLWDEGTYAAGFLMILSIPMALILFGIARVVSDRRIRKKHPLRYEVLRRYR